jgi:hypothetical protein
MKGGRKLKPILQNSVAYLAYYSLINYLPAVKQKGSFTPIKATASERVSNLTLVIN